MPFSNGHSIDSARNGTIMRPSPVNTDNKARLCQNRPVVKTPTALWGNQSMSRNDTNRSESSDVHHCPRDGCQYVTRSSRGLKIHHANAHGESIAKITVNCSNCGDEAEKKPEVVGRTENNFCGQDCWKEFYSREWVGEDHPAYKDRVSLECQRCGSSYQVLESKSTGSKYCSKECKDRTHSERMSGENHPNWVDPVELECKNCGEGYEVDAYKEEYRVFCSGECQAKYQVKENHPRWDGGWTPIGFGHTWMEQREKRLEIDGYSCQVCGMSREEHRDKYTHDIEVHHIMSRESFRDETEEIDFESANQIENLVTLCRKHHAKWEGIPLRPQRGDM